MNRRKALKNLGLSLGTITLSPAVLSLLQSCKNDLDWNPVFFNSNQVSVIVMYFRSCTEDRFKPNIFDTMV